MNKLQLHASVATLAIIFATGLCFAGEHPGKTVEHPKSEHPGKPVTAAFVKKSIKKYVKVQSKSNKSVFIVHDNKLDKNWNLKLKKIHNPVRMFEKEGKTIYFACSDFKSVKSKDMLDIDFWMIRKGDKLKVIDTKIHKVNGLPRYIYEGIKIKEIK